MKRIPLLPEYTSKGKRLHHRLSSLEPEQRIVREFLDRVKDGETLSSDEGLMAMNDGFMTSFIENEGEYQGLGYRWFKGKEIEIKTPKCPSRMDAQRALDSYIRAFNKSV